MKTNLKLLSSTAMLKLNYYKPEILLGVGIVGLVTSTVMAVKATPKAELILEESKERVEEIVDSEVKSFTKKRQLTSAHLSTASKVVRTYLPSVMVGTLSIGCILGSHRILKQRNVALASAYTLLEEGFNKYRERVVDRYGEEVDLEMRHGFKTKRIETSVTDDKGKVKNVNSDEQVMDPNDVSIYARFFDETSSQWVPTHEYNLLYLKSQQNYYNDLLKTRGHVFLNEVYEALGIPHSQAGAIVGWKLDKNGDNFIDFGIFDIHREGSREFVNGYERAILLDFNVDGVIYNKI